MRYFGTDDKFLAVEPTKVVERYMIAFQCYEKDENGTLDLCESSGQYEKDSNIEIFKADGTPTSVAEVGYLAVRQIRDTKLDLFFEGEEKYPEYALPAEIIDETDWIDCYHCRSKFVRIGNTRYECYEYKDAFVAKFNGELSRQGGVTWYARVTE